MLKNKGVHTQCLLSSWLELHKTLFFALYTLFPFMFARFNLFDLFP